MFLECIAKVGLQNVVQIITNNAAVIKSAGSIVIAKYPHIFWTPCVVHTCNLENTLLKMRLFGRIKLDYKSCWRCIFHMYFHNESLHKIGDVERIMQLKLFDVAKTWFASTLVMLKRLKIIRSLQNMVICEQWSAYREDDVGKVAIMRKLVLNDLWWDKVDYILWFIGPKWFVVRELVLQKGKAMVFIHFLR